MNKIYEQVLKLTNAAIHNEKPEFLGIEDWKTVLEYIYRGKLEGVVSSTICSLSEEEKPNQETLANLKNNTTGRAVAQIEAVRLLKGVLSEAHKRGIRLVNFKGLTLSALYPEPFMRFTSDYDLLVSKEQKAETDNMLIDLGFAFIKEHSEEHVHAYRKGRLYIEVHDCLWEYYTGKQAEMLKGFQLDSEERQLQLSIFGIDYYTLGYTEHLIYQVYHAAKHLAFEGMSLRFVTDIMLYIDRYYSSIDFEYFWKAMRDLKYDGFCSALLRIAEEGLGMRHRIIPNEYAKAAVNETLLKIILEKNASAEKGVEAYASMGFVSAYFMRDLKWEGNNISKKRKLFFPQSSQLKEKYAYAKKCRILLPVAWIHRICNAMVYAISCQIKGYKATDILKVADEKIKLLDDLNMLEN